MYRFAVCDDDEFYQQRIAGIIRRYALDHDIDCTVQVFGDARALVAQCAQHCYDAVFLDVQMPRMNGIEAGRRLRASWPRLPLVMVSNFCEYAVEGYPLGVFRYLLKDKLEQRLNLCLEELMELLAPRTIQLPVDGEVTALNLGRIESFQLGQGAMRIQFVDCAPPAVCRMSMARLEELVEGQDFLRTQRGCMVNLRQVERMRRYEMVMRSGRTVPVSERKYDQVRSLYAQWRLRHE